MKNPRRYSSTPCRYCGHQEPSVLGSVVLFFFALMLIAFCVAGIVFAVRLAFG